MREQPVVTEIDTKHTEDVHSRNAQDHAGPAEEPGKKREPGDEMGDSECVYVDPVPSHAFAPHARCRHRAKTILTEDGGIEIAVPRDRARIPQAPSTMRAKSRWHPQAVGTFRPLAAV